MRRSWLFIVPMVVWLLVFVSVGRAERPGQAQGGGWTIPPNGATEKSPLTVNDAVVANGKKLFGSKCQRCHGPAGKGDGPDGEPEHQDDMNLTNPARAARNPDGVVFYKIWNGRSSPKMPVFSEELSKEQVWALVAYVQTLRAK
ncbi:MAG: c-type cytochrome [Vicinamibacterales bacterium]